MWATPGEEENAKCMSMNDIYIYIYVLHWMLWNVHCSRRKSHIESVRSSELAWKQAYKSKKDSKGKRLAVECWTFEWIWSDFTCIVVVNYSTKEWKREKERGIPLNCYPLSIFRVAMHKTCKFQKWFFQNNNANALRMVTSFDGNNIIIQNGCVLLSVCRLYSFS